MGVSEKWDALTKPEPDSMRGRMLADEELSEEEFERLAYRIALEAHEDRLKLWETALERFERIQQLEAEDAIWDKHGLVKTVKANTALREYARHKADCQRHGKWQCTCGFAELYASLLRPSSQSDASVEHGK